MTIKVSQKQNKGYFRKNQNQSSKAINLKPKTSSTHNRTEKKEKPSINTL